MALFSKENKVFTTTGEKLLAWEMGQKQGTSEKWSGKGAKCTLVVAGVGPVQEIEVGFGQR